MKVECPWCAAGRCSWCSRPFTTSLPVAVFCVVGVLVSFMSICFALEWQIDRWLHPPIIVDKQWLAEQDAAANAKWYAASPTTVSCVSDSVYTGDAYIPLRVTDSYTPLRVTTNGAIMVTWAQGDPGARRVRIAMPWDRDALAVAITYRCPESTCGILKTWNGRFETSQECKTCERYGTGAHAVELGTDE